ncbi:MAG: hypothetical protein ISP74_07965 [Bacteroidia bacterium]|nr:hypothetical protein [Bacteroidia bacterium]
MATSHDIASYKSQRIFLENFRTGKWSNNSFSNKLIAKRTNKNWPSEDGNIIDDINKLSIAIEFKPQIETKRGIQTGIGQCITYLNTFSSAYLICPDEVEGFKIGNYLSKIFKKEIYGKLPIGLIQHKNNSGNFDLDLLVDISEDIHLNITTATTKESRYWAKYIDTNPHLFYLLLKIASQKEVDVEDRDHVIWDEFFNHIYFPKDARNLNPFISEINHFGERNMEPFRDKKKTLNQLVSSGALSIAEAIRELNEHCYWDGKPQLSRSKTGTDNLFRSYKKNYMKALDHIELWDSNCIPTDIGLEYLKIGDYYGPTSKEMLKFFGKLFLEHGNHFDLLLDLENSVKGTNLNSTTEARVHSQSYMEDKGLYKRNSARASVSGRTKAFSNEFQLWEKLGLFKSNKRYNPLEGYNFDWDKIDYYLK